MLWLLIAYFTIVSLIFGLWHMIKSTQHINPFEERPIPMPLFYAVMICPIIFILLLLGYSPRYFKYGCVWLFLYLFLLQKCVT